MLEGTPNLPPKKWMRPEDEAMLEGPGTFRAGDLVRIKHVEWAHPGIPEQTRRLLLLVPNEELGTHEAWVGPVDMSPREVQDFKDEFILGRPHMKKYFGCYPVDIGRLEKVSDA